MSIEELEKIFNLELVDLEDGEIGIIKFSPEFIDYLYRQRDEGIVNLYNSFLKRYPEKEHKDFINHATHVVNVGLPSLPMKLNPNKDIFKPLMRNYKIQKLIDNDRKL